MFLNDSNILCNIMMMKNLDEIINVLMNEESENEEEEKKVSLKATTPPKDSAFRPSKILPALLRIEEKLRNDW